MAGDLHMMGPDACTHTVIDLPLVAGVEGDIIIEGCDELIRVSMTGLTVVGGTVTIGNNALLSEIDMGSLVIIGSNQRRSRRLGSTDAASTTSVQRSRSARDLDSRALSPASLADRLATAGAAGLIGTDLALLEAAGRRMKDTDDQRSARRARPRERAHERRRQHDERSDGRGGKGTGGGRAGGRGVGDGGSEGGGGGQGKGGGGGGGAGRRTHVEVGLHFTPGVELTQLPALTSVQLDALVEAGDIALSAIDALVDFSLPALESASSLSLDGLASLASLDAPLLELLDDLSAIDLPALGELVLPLLGNVNGDVLLDAINAVTVEFASLLSVAGDLALHESATQSLLAPLLEAVKKAAPNRHSVSSPSHVLSRRLPLCASGD